MLRINWRGAFSASLQATRTPLARLAPGAFGKCDPGEVHATPRTWTGGRPHSNAARRVDGNWLIPNTESMSAYSQLFQTWHSYGLTHVPAQPIFQQRLMRCRLEQHLLPDPDTNAAPLRTTNAFGLRPTVTDNLVAFFGSLICGHAIDSGYL